MDGNWKRTEDGYRLEGTEYTVENRDEEKRQGYWDVFIGGEWSNRFKRARDAKRHVGNHQKTVRGEMSWQRLTELRAS